MKLWNWIGFGVVTLAGTILHFLYDWTGGSIWAAPFSGVNESVWEHMKLLYWPLFFFALVQRLCFRGQENFWRVKLWGTLLGLVLIPVLFYTYNGAFGKSPDWLNIAIFYISAGAVFLFEYWAFKIARPSSQLSFVLLCLVGVLIVVFTFAPPRLPLFQDPNNNFSFVRTSLPAKAVV